MYSPAIRESYSYQILSRLARNKSIQAVEWGGAPLRVRIHAFASRLFTTLAMIVSDIPLDFLTWIFRTITIYPIFERGIKTHLLDLCDLPIFMIKAASLPLPCYQRALPKFSDSHPLYLYIQVMPEKELRSKPLMDNPSIKKILDSGASFEWNNSPDGFKLSMMERLIFFHSLKPYREARSIITGLSFMDRVRRIIILFDRLSPHIAIELPKIRQALEVIQACCEAIMTRGEGRIEDRIRNNTIRATILKTYGGIDSQGIHRFSHMVQRIFADFTSCYYHYQLEYAKNYSAYCSLVSRHLALLLTHQRKPITIKLTTDLPNHELANSQDLKNIIVDYLYGDASLVQPVTPYPVMVKALATLFPSDAENARPLNLITSYLYEDPEIANAIATQGAKPDRSKAIALQPAFDCLDLFIYNNEQERQNIEHDLISMTNEECTKWISSVQYYLHKNLYSSHILFSLLEYSWFSLAALILQNPERYGITIESIKTFRTEQSGDDFLSYVLSLSLLNRWRYRNQNLHSYDQILHRLIVYDVVPHDRVLRACSLAPGGNVELIRWLLRKAQSLQIQLPNEDYIDLFNPPRNQHISLCSDVIEMIIADRPINAWSIVSGILEVATSVGNGELGLFVLNHLGKDSWPTVPAAANPQYYTNLLQLYMEKMRDDDKKSMLDDEEMRKPTEDLFIKQLLVIGASFQSIADAANHQDGFNLSILERFVFFNSWDFKHSDEFSVNNDAYWSSNAKRNVEWFNFFSALSVVEVPEIQQALTVIGECCTAIMKSVAPIHVNIFDAIVLRIYGTTDNQGVQTVHRFGSMLRHLFTVFLDENDGSRRLIQNYSFYCRSLSHYLSQDSQSQPITKVRGEAVAAYAQGPAANAFQ